MKKILSIFTVLFTALTFGQNVDPYLQPNSSPTSGQWNKGTLQVDGDFVLPTTLNSFTNPSLRDYGKLRYDTNDSIPKYFNGIEWKSIGNKYLDIRDFGAIANDSLDDSQAINEAITRADMGIYKAVYFPEGVWQIDSTITLSGDIEYFGEGGNKSIIRSLPGAETGLSLITPLDGATVNPDLFTYRTMIATKGADYTVTDTIKNIRFHGIGIDWNDINGGVNSVLPIALVRIQDSEFYNNKIFDALPADLEDLNEERQGHGLLLGFAKNNYIHHNDFGASDYETVAIRYLSQENHVHHNIFSVNKPDTYHWQSHALQFARPTPLVTSLEAQFGESKIKNNYVYNNEFYLVNNVLHAVTSHSSIGAYVNYNYVKFYEGTLAWGFKFFDETSNFTAIGNVFDAVGANTNFFPETSRGVTNHGVTFIGINSTSTHDDVFNGVISDNIIDIQNTTPNTVATPSYIAPIIGGNNISKGSNITISNNVISIDGYDDYAKPVFGTYGDGINLIGNTVKISNPFTSVTSGGLQFLRIKDGKGVNVSNNVVTGTSLGKGIVIDNTSFEDIRISPVNYQSTVVGDKLSTGLTNQSEIKVFANSINGSTADADGNISLSIPTVDATPTDGSPNAVSSGGVADALDEKLNLVPGGTDLQYTGGGSISKEAAVRGTTASTDPEGGATTQITSGTTFREAVWRLQNQVNLKANKAGDTYTGTHNFTGATVVGLSVTNTSLVSSQTASDLNTLYPTAPEGFEVLAPNITPARVYKKTSVSGQWIDLVGTTLNP